jgi:hypothetical protein
MAKYKIGDQATLFDCSFPKEDELHPDYLFIYKVIGYDRNYYVLDCSVKEEARGYDFVTFDKHTRKLTATEEALYGI